MFAAARSRMSGWTIPEDRPAEEVLRPRRPDEGGGGGVREDDRPVHVDQDRVRRELDQVPVLRLALPQGRLLLVEARDVERDEDDVLVRPRQVHRRRAEQDLEDDPVLCQPLRLDDADAVLEEPGVPLLSDVRVLLVAEVQDPGIAAHQFLRGVPRHGAEVLVGRPDHPAGRDDADTDGGGPEDALQGLLPLAQGRLGPLP